MTPRGAALLAVLLLGTALVVIVVLTTPWQSAPVPSQGRTPVDVGRDFTAEQIQHEKGFHGQLRPWSYTRLALGLVVTLILGLTPLGARIVELVARPLGGGWVWQALLGGLALGVLGQLVTLPLSMRAEVVLRDYGLSTQNWTGWWIDIAKSWLVSAVIGAGALLVFYAVVRAAPRWWWAWLAAGAAAVVFVFSFLYPVLIEPIFNKFAPMPASALRTELVEMAARDGVPVSEVLVADASRRTTALNAYVSGYGASRRIVVYDTLLRDAPAEEVKLVVAHELGHAKRNDVLYGTAIGALGVATGVGVLYLLLGWAPLLRRAGVEDIGDPRSMALVMAVMAVGALLLGPAQNLLSRRIESRADEHALVLTGDPDTFIQMQRRLAVKNLADLDPNPVVYWMFSSHPTSPERIAHARDFAARSRAEEPR